LTRIAAEPLAFEPPSAGFVLEWSMNANWQKRGVRFATLTHAAGIFSTGHHLLDARLPFDEPYRIPRKTADAIAEAKSAGSRVIAIGTTVVRAIESAATGAGRVLAGDGIARGRILRETRLRVADGIIIGLHHPGERHFELLRAFADDATLGRVSRALAEGGYHPHEFGESLLIEQIQERVAELICFGDVSLYHGEDRYGRTLGRLEGWEADVESILLRHGLAYPPSPAPGQKVLRISY
jgi:S-adenosylmethionine:tRNA ribosyltransferase-isomerase